MQIRFSESAAAGMAKFVPDESRRKTCEVHLKFFLSADPLQHAIRCEAFDDIDIFVYRFGPYRVLFELSADIIRIWSFAPVGVSVA